MRVLLIDDFRLPAGPVVRSLRELDVHVEVAHGPAAGSRLALAGSHDALVLDLAAPGLDPLALCRRLRAGGLPAPIVVLSDRREGHYEVAAFDAGADDFLRRPFPVAVLAARLRALVRRGAPRTDVLRCGSLVLDPASRGVRRRGVPVELTPREFDLLEVLLRAGGDPVPKTELLDRVWGRHGGARANSVEVYVHYLRSKIDAPFGVRTLRTVHGTGYRLVPAS